jgi:TolB-like protein
VLSGGWRVEGFFGRLKERKLVQWVLAYAAAAFALLQGVDIVAQRFGWPESIERGLIVVLAVGFFVTIVLAWFHGERGAQRVTSTELLILTLLLAIGGGLLWRMSKGPQNAAATDSAKPVATLPTAIPDKSIAVLPFVDMSPAHDQGYFSDGMSEEILNALAQVKDLKVTGRTSSFYFKGRNESLRTIGSALGVANILEGSVRKQGDKVRITAQLIQVSDDTHLWSHDYDGDLSDVFTLQDNIALAITDQLKAVLTVDQKAHLVQAGTTNTDAYKLYLQATDALNHRDYKRMGDAIGWLEQAIRLDPKFAQAHARLAMVHALGWSQYGASEDEAARQAKLAYGLDPNIAETQYALSFLARKQRRFLESHEALDRALALAPEDASANFYYAQALINTGYTHLGTEQLDRTLAIDPLLPNALHWRAMQYLFTGDIDSAERLWKRADDAGLSYANVGLANVAKARGDYPRARALLLPTMLTNTAITACLKDASVSLPVFLRGTMGGDAQERANALAVVDECLAAKPERVPLWTVQGLMVLGQNERVLQVIAQGPTMDDAGLFNYFWSDQQRGLRRSPGFPEFARKVGFAVLWDRFGPPDGCRRKALSEYVCE